MSSSSGQSDLICMIGRERIMDDLSILIERENHLRAKVCIRLVPSLD